MIKVFELLFKLHLSKITVTAITLAVSALPIQAQTPLQSDIVSQQATFDLVTVTSGLQHPWGMAFLPNGDLLVTERPGRLRLITSQGLDPQPIPGVPDVAAQGQGGLLDVALHPNFNDNRWIYLSYSAFGNFGRAGTQVARARFENNQLSDLEVIFDMSIKTTRRLHFGSRLAFDPAGFLYISTGDRGERWRSQDLADAAGKVLRLQDDGSVPVDNPFVNQPEALSDVFTWGHRNIQGMTVHPTTGEIWTHEHGPRGGDEINVLAAGTNYGWPIITHGREYSGGIVGEGLTAQPGLAQPLLHWTPSIAPSGMAIYSGEVFPEWQGDVFVGALAGQHLARVEVEGQTVVDQERLLEGVGRVRDVEQGLDGRLYLLIDARNGALLRLDPS